MSVIGGKNMITAQAVFNNMAKELKRVPDLDEFTNKGYSARTYYRCKKNYKEEKNDE